MRIRTPGPHAVALIALAGATIGCASLIVQPDDSLPKKGTKATARVVLGVATLGISEILVQDAKPKPPKPKYCWSHESGDTSAFHRDNAECSMIGDPAGGYLTGGLAGAVAAKRRYDFCMQSKGYFLEQCGYE